jgi:hypothetical protein
MFIVLFMVFNQLKKLKMAPLVLDRTQLYWEKKSKNITHKCPSVKNEYNSWIPDHYALSFYTHNLF